MLIEQQDALRVWLAKELAPVCDAEPEALAKYVQALLRKDKPENELIDFCIEQLDVFLQAQARPFVKKLFEVIKERSYIPSQPSIKTASVEISGDMVGKAGMAAVSFEKKKDVDERKETKEKEEERRKSQSEKDREQRKVRDEREIEKKVAPQELPTSSNAQPQRAIRKRISPPPVARDDIRRDGPNRFERRRSRSPRDRRVERGDRIPDRRGQIPPNVRGSHRINERYKSERVERKRSRSPYERIRRDKSAEGERKKKRCRDYDEKGYCMKGDQCIYDHGPDPLVVDDNSFEKMVSGGAKASTVVPQIAPNFSVPPPGYTSVNPPPPGVDSVYMAGAAAVPAVIMTEGYNPEAPALSAPAVIAPVQSTVPIASVDFSVPPPTIPYSNPSWAPPVYPTSSASASVLVHPPSLPYDSIQPSTTISISTPQVVPSQPQISRGGGAIRRGRGGIGGYGSGSGGAATGNNRTLQVRKIPPEMNNITKLNEHFAQFGQIVNIQVCYDGDLEAALITYATRLEAMAAYKSTTPILNNRFIKVFWHSPGGQITQGVKNVPPATGSSVKFNSKGSLTKTVILGSQKTSGILNAVQVDSSQKPTGMLDSQSQASTTEGENYMEIRRKRKLAKENRLRLLDFNRRKTDLLAKQIEQQKLIIDKLQKTTNPETKKELLKIFKKVDESVGVLKKELEELGKKLVPQDAEESEKGTNGVEVVESNGATNATGFKRGSGSGHHHDASVSTKKPRYTNPTQAFDKRTRVVVVGSFPLDYEDDVIKHMEKFGELEDVDIPDRTCGKGLAAYFTYKERHDAEQAVALASDFSFCQLTVGWGSKGGYERDGVVPDEKRNPAERVTPAALLASCPLEESDDDGNED